MTGTVLSVVVEELEDRDGLSGVRPHEITVGESVVLVELVVENSDGGIDRRLAGLAHNPEGSDGSDSRPAVSDLKELFAPIDRPETDGLADGSIDRAVALATLNALSSPYIEWQTGDPMALLPPSVDVIVTVGLFAPALRKFADVEVRVIEREPIGAIETPDDVTIRPFRPTETTMAMSGADAVFVTGSTFIYGGLERYIAATPELASLTVVGATASVLPGPLFERGVDIVAGAEVADPDRVRRAVEDGACGTDLHNRGLGKVYTENESSANISLR